MQNAKLPLSIDPIKSAQKRLDYEGIYTVNQLVRLSGAVNSVTTDAKVQLSFDVDVQGLKTISGRAEVEVCLECQRCWEHFPYHCEVEFVYSPIFHSERANDLPEAYEPALVDENGEIDLLQLVEDELILALPQVAMHEEVDCKVNPLSMVYGEISPADERPNPFAVLKNLKRKT